MTTVRRDLAQQGHLARSQIPELPRADVVVLDWADANAAQANDGMADRIAHVPHLPVASLANHE